MVVKGAVRKVDEAAAVVVVLAAGRGTRFAAAAGDDATHKLAQPLGGGSTVIGRTLTVVLQSRLPLVVVTAPALLAEVTRTVAARDVAPLPSQGSSPEGMGTSIAIGVAARPHASGWLILPGDMPALRPESLRLVAAELAGHPVAYAQHRGRRGHPVGFAAELYSELVQLSGDEGARRLVARYPAHGVELDDEGVLIDIDTPADLRRFAGGEAQAVPR
ncbi:MAG TPA: nucleotidyltransferase family protein [Methylibium sp.]|uniref:nucleotidyltransferase family protein n=1 Tax=Methylibium sp. TaxID=2067992 RepID=UPI002DB62EA1|nr:nucleotidyltransferase family protein [Methylibium sp.]HEU4457554.1 nucleotidyltransferase family protein [Methylibium sp.]